jgi:outer membrane protein assembly factor BamB
MNFFRISSFIFLAVLVMSNQVSAKPTVQFYDLEITSGEILRFSQFSATSGEKVEVRLPSGEIRAVNPNSVRKIIIYKDAVSNAMDVGWRFLPYGAGIGLVLGLPPFVGQNKNLPLDGNLIFGGFLGYGIGFMVGVLNPSEQIDLTQRSSIEKKEMVPKILLESIQN